MLSGRCDGSATPAQAQGTGGQPFHARGDGRAGHGREVALAERLVDRVESARLAPVVPERAAGLVARVADEGGLVGKGLGQSAVMGDRAAGQ